MSGIHPIRDRVLTAFILSLTLGFYGYTVLDVMTHARTWIDEVTYLIKSWSYVSGSVSPYTDQDPTWYMPLYFYELGFWQRLLEPGIWQGRMLSAILGALNSILIIDIVRRITGNLIAGAFAAAVFLTVPAVTFYFGTATPIATVSLLLLVTVWVMITGLARQSVWRSLCLGVLFAVLYFFRQNMILAILVLAPLYVLGLSRSRFVHSVLILTGLTAVTAALLFIFPERLLTYAMRLPVVTPVLTDLNLMQSPLHVIEANTVADVGLGLALANIAWPDIVDAFVLPYAGLILTSVTVFFLASGKLRLLALAPVLFLYLATTHYLGSLDYCQTCILPYTASFAGLGAIGAGIAIALIMHRSRRDLLPGPVLATVFTGITIGLSQSATGLATRDEYRFYPAAMLNNPRPISEQVETQYLADFLRNNTAPGELVLPIHDLITVPYAVFLADRSFPTQGINLRHSYRHLKPGLSEPEKTEVLGVLKREGLWTDEVLQEWIENEVDTIVFQADPRGRDSDLEQQISQLFNRTASTGFRGWNIHLYKRKSDSESGPLPDSEG